MKKTLGRTCLFLLASTFLFENAGFLTHELNLAAGLIFLAALALSYLPFKIEKTALYEIIPGIVLMIVAVAVMPGEFLRPGALALFLLGLGLLLRGFGRRTPELPIFAVTAAGYGLYMFLYRTDPHVWAWARGVSFAFSRAVACLTAWLPGVKAQLGPTFLGAGTIVTFALLFIVGSFFLSRNRLRKAGRALGTMALLAAVYVVISSYLPSALTFQLKVGPVPSEAEKSRVQQETEYNRERTTLTESDKATKVVFSSDSLLVNNCPLWMPSILALLFFIPTYFFFKDAELRALPLSSSVLFSAAGVILLIAVALIQTDRLRLPARDELEKAISSKRVGFYSYGLVNWMRPSFKQFGERSSGMFGNLPDFAEAMGFNQPKPETRDQAGYTKAGVLLTEITEESLKDIDILMLPNVMGARDSQMFNSEIPSLYGPKPTPAQLARQAELAECKTDGERLKLMEKWYQEALERIWKFVADGGSLILLGDHTFYKPMKLPGNKTRTKLWVNDILEPFGIKFVNDSAKYFIGGWLQSLQNPLHALTFGLRDDQNEVGMVTGASLALSGGARPVIVGKFGFLDAGDLRDRMGNYLGNMDYDVGEPLGEIIIAAEQTYGKGKVIVFGDTGAFANGIITNTGDFCNRIFAWLAVTNGRGEASADNPAATFDPRYVATGAGTLTTAITILLLVGSIICFRLSGGHAGVVAGALAIGLVVASHSAEAPIVLGRGVNGDIRVAYIDNYHLPKISKEGSRDDSLMALHLNLMRNGFYSQNLKRFDLETLKGADLLVIAAPSVPFTREDVTTVKQYVEAGGKVILTAGHEDLPATHRLLDAFDLRIPNTPLGWFRFPIAAVDGRHAMFWRAWPIESTKDDPDPEVIILYAPKHDKKYNLIVKRDLGKGSFIAVGDSGYWMNKNIEIEKLMEKSKPEQEQYFDNIYITKWLLETYVPQQKESE